MLVFAGDFEVSHIAGTTATADIFQFQKYKAVGFFHGAGERLSSVPVTMQSRNDGIKEVSRLR